MATTHTPRETHKAFSEIVRNLTHEVTTDEAGTRRHPMAVAVTAGLTRLALGWTFLWAFLDKTFGLGHETPSEAAWVNGGSPTEGFLAHAPVGPFADFYNGIAGAAWADWLFMVGLAGIGVALILGVFTNLAALSGATMLFLMWTAVLPPENNPFMDDHLIYGAVLVLLALLGAGRYLGLGAYWERLPLVKRARILR